ncbi:HIT family protein [Mycoplasmoides pirum]|uniref:HIT family protein n=1 Tax=Mycoplasmoides pirum TaxID=2122 RepID=UPI00047F3CC7|nr:HIT family protein [Mycoplasmoides pirum]
MLENCVFCKIINKEIEAKILDENEFAIAFLDVNPTANGHTIVIPKQHFKDLSSTNEIFLNGVFNLVKSVSKKLKNSKLDPWGINYLSNEGNIAGQEVFHFHVHVIPKYAAGEGFGFKTNKINLQPIDEIYKDIN